MSVQRRLEILLYSVPEVSRWKVDKEIDFENVDIKGRTVPQHLGRIAAVMTNWEGDIATALGLTMADQSDIVEKCYKKTILQR